MITSITLDGLENLLEKSRKKSLEKNPKVEIVEPGLFKVTGSTGNIYQVRAGRTANGEFFIACNCRGALESKPCYHGAKVFWLHKKIKELEIDKRKNTDIDNSPYLRKTDEKPLQTIGKVRI